jgi:hypothetical protein
MVYPPPTPPHPTDRYWCLLACPMGINQEYFTAQTILLLLYGVYYTAFNLAQIRVYFFLTVMSVTSFLLLFLSIFRHLAILKAKILLFYIHEDKRWRPDFSSSKTVAQYGRLMLLISAV